MENTEQGISDDASRGKRRKKTMAFALPIAIQTVLTIIYLSIFFGHSIVPQSIYGFIVALTILYTVLLFAVAVLCATSMTLESISADIKRNKKQELQWIRTYFKIVRKFIPAYNTSFGTIMKKLVGGLSSIVYAFSLIVNGFVGNAITVVFSVCLIWFGMWTVRDSYEWMAELKRMDAARKAKEIEAGKEISQTSRVYRKQTL